MSVCDPRLIGRLARLAVAAWLLAGPPVAVAADGAPNTSNREGSIRQTETEAEARHTRALRECAAAADYASCARDADATLHNTRRRLTGGSNARRQRLAARRRTRNACRANA